MRLERRDLVFLGIAFIYFFAGIWFPRFLGFEIVKDELHYWPTALRFSEDWMPSLALLRNYDELSTPLPFMIWGWCERLFQGGIVVGRALNGVLALSVLYIFIRQIPRLRSAIIGIVGLLLFPYFVGCAIHLYTDIIAIFFVLAGFLAYRSGRSILSTLLFILAIATRQYMIAFPFAIGLYELISFLRLQDKNGRQIVFRTVTFQLIACASLLGWYILWSGFAPEHMIIAHSPETSGFVNLLPRNSLYFLAVLGGYVVIPEMLLLRPFVEMRRKYMLQIVCIAFALLILFILFPPIENTNFIFPRMGFMDKFVRLFCSDMARMAVYYFLALVTVIRYWRFDQASVLVWCNVLLMTKAHIAWDKYALPLAVLLWFLSAEKSSVACETEELTVTTLKNMT